MADSHRTQEPRSAIESPALFHVAIEIKPGALIGLLVLANSRSQAIDHVYGRDHAAILSCVEVKRVSACAWTLNRMMYEKEEYAAIERTLVGDAQDERAIGCGCGENEPVGWPRIADLKLPRDKVPPNAAVSDGKRAHERHRRRLTTTKNN